MHASHVVTLTDEPSGGVDRVTEEYASWRRGIGYVVRQAVIEKIDSLPLTPTHVFLHYHLRRCAAQVRVQAVRVDEQLHTDTTTEVQGLRSVSPGPGQAVRRS
ncbi:hypothetical protein D3C87_1840760 [compost metagenome]